MVEKGDADFSGGMRFEVFEDAFFVKGFAEDVGTQFVETRVLVEGTGGQELQDAATAQYGAVFFGSNDFHRAWVGFQFGAESIDPPTAKHQ